MGDPQIMCAASAPAEHPWGQNRHRCRYPLNPAHDLHMCPCNDLFIADRAGGGGRS